MKALIALGLAIALASPAVAQEDSQPKLRHYNFGELIINGERVYIPVENINVKDRLVFESLLKLDKAVLPKLKRSGKDVALR